MKTKLVERNGKSVLAYLPEAEDVLNLKVGDEAPDAFGKLNPVTKISIRGGDTYVHYYTKLSSNSEVSNTMAVGSLMLSLHLTLLLNAAECDQLEEEMRS